MVATSLLLDPHLTKRTRLRGPLNLEQVLLCGFILIGSLFELRAAHTFVPFDLVSKADLGVASLACYVRLLRNLIDLTMLTIRCRTPDPVDGDLPLCLRRVNLLPGGRLRDRRQKLSAYLLDHVVNFLGKSPWHDASCLFWNNSDIAQRTSARIPTRCTISIHFCYELSLEAFRADCGVVIASR